MTITSTFRAEPRPAGVEAVASTRKPHFAALASTVERRASDDPTTATAREIAPGLGAGD
jgi:hypothetical protein